MIGAHMRVNDGMNETYIIKKQLERSRKVF